MPVNSWSSAGDLKALVEVSKGVRPADLYIRGGRLINVYSGEIFEANVAVCRDRIAYVGLRQDMIGPETKVIEAESCYLSPGYIEPHTHPWALYNPASLSEAVLPRGTTAMFYDNLFFFMLIGSPDAYRDFVRSLSRLPVKIFWNARLISQSSNPDDERLFSLQRIEEFELLESTAAAAEVTQWPLVYQGDERLLEKISYFKKRWGRIDGHTAGCSYEKLNAVAAAGIDSCHESISRQEALERLRLGMYVMLRHSSLRRDLRELIKIVTLDRADTSRLMLTNDGASPDFIQEHGHVDYLVKVAIEEGVDPIKAIQMVTINPATYYRLDCELGGIAPGRIADILILDSPRNPRPRLVVASGKVVAEEGRLVCDFPAVDLRGIPFERPQAPPGREARPEFFGVPCREGEMSFPVIDLVSPVITRRADMLLKSRSGFLDVSTCQGVLNIALLSKKLDWVSNGIVRGFAERLEGFASSYNTSTHILVVGSDRMAMARAAQRVLQLGGGIVVVERGEIIYELPLQIGGMMSVEPFDAVAGEMRRLAGLFQERGYRYHDLLYTILFLPCDFLPDLRLTRYGLCEIKRGAILYPSRAI